MKKIKENVDLAQPLILSDIQQIHDPTQRLKSWLGDTLDIATSHFKGTLDDSDILDILSDLKAKYSSKSNDAGNKSGDLNRASFSDKINQHLSDFFKNLDRIDEEWNQTKDHQQNALQQFKNLQKMQSKQMTSHDMYEPLII